MAFSCDKTVVFLCSLCSSGMVNVRLCSFNTDQPFLAGFFIYFCLSCKNVMFGVFLIKMEDDRLWFSYWCCHCLLFFIPVGPAWLIRRLLLWNWENLFWFFNDNDFNLCFVSSIATLPAASVVSIPSVISFFSTNPRTLLSDLSGSSFYPLRMPFIKLNQHREIVNKVQKFAIFQKQTELIKNLLVVVCDQTASLQSRTTQIIYGDFIVKRFRKPEDCRFNYRSAQYLRTSWSVSSKTFCILVNLYLIILTRKVKHKDIRGWVVLNQNWAL